MVALDDVKQNQTFARTLKKKKKKNHIPIVLFSKHDIKRNFHTDLEKRKKNHTLTVKPTVVSCNISFSSAVLFNRLINNTTICLAHTPDGVKCYMRSQIKMYSSMQVQCSQRKFKKIFCTMLLRHISQVDG